MTSRKNLHIDLKIAKIKKFQFLLISLFILSSCQVIDRPEYWSCLGNTTQIVDHIDNTKKELYEGKQRLMIEIFDHSVSQFASPAAFGRYEICINTDEYLIFKYPNCQISEIENDSSDSYKRIGNLNKYKNEISYQDQRIINEKKINTKGIFACKYLGHTYSYEDMTLEEN